MSLSQDLQWRGLIKDKTFKDGSWLDQPKTFYLGIDASSDSLTIGNLAVAMLARRLVDSGWSAVLLAGGATSLIGDPGGKEEERELKSEEEIASNIKAVGRQIEKLFSGKPHQMVNNLDWLGGVKYLDFLRDVGKNYSMTELVQRDFVSTRMGDSGSGISYAEFSYSLLQGYDFWWLFKNKGVGLQIGGSDQWGNMLSGVALIRKKEGKEAHAMSMPLIISKSTGKKFGKSEEGAVWLDPAKTTPSQFYQFWINASDSDVEDHLKVFTLLSKDNIDEIIRLHIQDPSKRIAQKRLADAVTVLVHGDDGVEIAQQYTNLITGTTTEGAEPMVLKSGVSLIEALVATGLVSSNSEARRVIDEGGVYVDNQSASSEVLDKSQFKDGRLVLRRGKKLSNTALIELE